ncbi:MAG TPA: hypothetical protein VFU13_11505 [Steroidobacteraceae bacterium]|nr:hypothetical protein [Steroidobacteraceae bacterium]
MSDARRELETLARAFAARQGRHDPSACPPAEQLFEAASGGLDRERRFAIVDHVSKCAECAEAWRLAMELGARPASRVGESARAKLPRYAAAASVMVAVGLTAYFVRPGYEQPPQYRDVANGQAPVSRIGERLSRRQFVLRWSAGPEGSTYAVRLTTADLVLVFEKQDITGVELAVPAAMLEKVPAGEPLLWQVEVHLPNGQRVTSQTFVVTPD